MADKNYMVSIFCRQCHSSLFKYLKEGGEPQALKKCYSDNITENFTGDFMHCPKCGEEFSRESMVHGRPAYKISRGKVFVRR